MFNLLGDGIDGIYKGLWLLIGLQLVLSGGIGFIFRLISRPLNINFNNEKLSSIDTKILDLQLLRLYHGINVNTMEEAELAALAISRGKLKPQKIWLIFFYPAIGRSKHGKFEFFLIGFIFFYCLFNAFYLAHDSGNYRRDYVLLNDSSGKVLISEIYVKDLNSGENLNRSECRDLPKKSKQILKTACHYLTTDDPYLRKELTTAIDKNNNNLTFTIFTSLFFVFLACLIGYSYSTYREVNNQFYEFKKQEIKYRAQQLYKNAFKNHSR